MVYPEWVYAGHTDLIPRADIINRTKYGDTGKCPVLYCRNPSSWWLCSNCGAPTCKAHQVFNGYIVIKCYYCNGNWQWQRKLAKILKNQKQKS